MADLSEHRTVSRVTAILELVSAAPTGVRLSEIATALEAPKSSVLGLVRGLVSTGYLTTLDGAYFLGPALGSLVAVGPLDLRTAARPSLLALRDEFNETAILSTLAGRSAVYLDAAESQQAIRYSATLNVRRPLYPTSTGKIFLAYWPERRRESYLESHLPDPSVRARARKELVLVREEGVAFNRGETLPDVSAAARPIVVKGRLVAALGIGGPTTRTGAKLAEFAEALATQTLATERRLG